MTSHNTMYVNTRGFLLGHTDGTMPKRPHTNGTVGIHNAPPYLRTNSFITSGFRRQMSPTRCLASIFSLHNETVSIWTALVPLAVSVVALLDTVTAPGPVDGPFVGTVVFLVSIVAAFAASAAAHTLSPVSKAVKLTLFKLDYACVWTTTAASGVAHMLTAPHGLSAATQAWLLATLLCLTLTAVVVTVHHAAPDQAHTRVATFVALAAVANVPALVAVLRQAAPAHGPLTFNAYLLAGGVHYAARIPERFSPGMFDLFGHGHQVMHILVAVAMAVQYDWITNHHTPF